VILGKNYKLLIVNFNKGGFFGGLKGQFTGKGMSLSINYNNSF